MILCGNTLEETLEHASSKIGEDVLELRSQGGGGIDSLQLLRYQNSCATPHCMMNDHFC